MRYPFVVEQTWAVLDQLATDMLRWPSRYQTEADIQAEFHRRLSNAFEATGTDIYGATWNDEHGEEIYPKFSRIGCQHGVRAKDSGTLVFPDIVIYDDLEDPEAWPDDDWQWPVSMAIEFKHRHKTAPDHADVLKLARLIRHENAQFGCWINVERTSDSENKAFTTIH